MRQGKPRKPIIAIRLPLIKERSPANPANSAVNRSLKLERINRQKNMAIIDISKINKIEREYAQITKLHENQREEETKEEKGKESKEGKTSKQVQKDQMRESKLLLLRNLGPKPKKQNVNLLSSLVAYNSRPVRMKEISIPTANISASPTKQRKTEKKVQSEKQLGSQYAYPELLLKVDFVRMFIVEELLYYISKTGERLRDEMAGFCKFYNENTDQEAYLSVSQVLLRNHQYLTAIFFQKLGFYVYLILGTDADIQQEAHYLLSSLGEYMHTNNLIILDLLMEIIDVEKYPIASQFHVYNTSRFNEDRRKIRFNEDRMNLLAKNNGSLAQIIKGIVSSCGFQSLKTFVFEIIANQDTSLLDKIREVALMLVSLDGILTSSTEQYAAKPKPPFLPARQKPVKYTLVLDMDETLIHTHMMQAGKSAFLVRPYCQQFLDEMDRYFEIVIFTAAVKEYADKILDSIDPQQRISHRLYREHTRIEEFVSIKDLALINRDLSETIIIDNIASNFKLQARNGIEITTWTGDPDDNSLLNLIPVLKKLAVEEVHDVRDALEMLSEYMENKMTKGQEIVFDQIALKGV